MVAPLSDVPQEGSSVFSLFYLIKLHSASLPLASSYSRVAVSSVFWAQNIYFSDQTRGASLTVLPLIASLTPCWHFLPLTSLQAPLKYRRDIYIYTWYIIYIYVYDIEDDFGAIRPVWSPAVR